MWQFNIMYLVVVHFPSSMHSSVIDIEIVIMATSMAHGEIRPPSISFGIFHTEHIPVSHFCEF